MQSPEGNYIKLKDESSVSVELPEEVKKKIDEILDRICDLTDDEINRMVVESPYYDKL